VRRDLGSAARLLVVPTLALIAIAFFAPVRLALGVRIYALILCAAVIVVLLSALRRAYPDETALSTSATRPIRNPPPPSLGRIEHEAALGVAGSFDLHYRLVPRLRALATGLLTSRRQISLDTSRDAAHEVLGEETWELVRPDRPAPEDRLARGITPRELGQVVDALEGV
jgi:hypothetical protein